MANVLRRRAAGVAMGIARALAKSPGASCTSNCTARERGAGFDTSIGRCISPKPLVLLEAVAVTFVGKLVAIASPPTEAAIDPTLGSMTNVCTLGVGTSGPFLRIRFRRGMVTRGLPEHCAFARVQRRSGKPQSNCKETAQNAHYLGNI